MRGVGGQGDLDFAITKHLQVGALSTEVVLDVAGTTSLGGIDVAFELVEQGVQGLANDVGEHIQATAVGHTNDNFIQALACGGVDYRIHQRDEGFCTLEGESLLANVLSLEEVLERLRSVELL